MANSFINKKVDLTTTDLTSLYTVPNFKTSVVKSILVSNDSGSSCNLDVTLVNASSAIFSLFKTKAVDTNTTVELLSQPLVKIAKKNKIVRKILEHIAVHSTIDMRQSMRGKKHLLGRLYRKIILPICYWAGKK